MIEDLETLNSGPLIGNLSDTRGLSTIFLVLVGLAGRSFLHHQTAVEQQAIF